jgi:hypothetical protein
VNIAFLINVLEEISAAISFRNQRKDIVPVYTAHYKKKFWEELIAYFPLIRHVPHRK